MQQTEQASTRRGPYAQGRKSRELILDAALDVISERGYNATSLRDISEKVGLTQAGLLHHFGSRESLLTEVLRQRDEANLHLPLKSTDPDEPLIVKIARHNERVPGLVHLYVSLEAAAADRNHPAHTFFLDRNRTVHARITQQIRTLQQRARITPNVEADQLARMLIALSDGLQAQRLIDPSIDLAKPLEMLWRTYLIGSGAPKRSQ